VDWSQRGSIAVDVGDLETARECFAKAVKSDQRNAHPRLRLAIVLEALGEIGPAAESLTIALRLAPSMADAARRLCLLLSREGLPDGARIDTLGLKAALGHDKVDREAVAEAVVAYLSRSSSLSRVLGVGRTEGWLQAARALCLKKTEPLLKDELFLEVLRTSVLRNVEIERLLTALRRVLLLEIERSRFEDRALFGFAVALLHQCHANEHVWAVSPEEARAIADSTVVTGEAFANDGAAGAALLLAALYRPVTAMLGQHAPSKVLDSIRPRALRDAVALYIAEAVDVRARAAQLPRLGTVTDETSHKVAQQYERSPYPRWTSVGIPRDSDSRRMLASFFEAGRLAFLDRPFEVLIAGCGTGQQAVQSALIYGPDARVLGLDLSLASLGYASRMADRFGVKNLELAQGDIQQIGTSGAQFRSRFEVIECTGVLHHMSDPLQGWRALLEALAPGGIMCIGLYSAVARRNLAVLRRDPSYPGPDCSDDALRAFRQILLERPEDARGAELKISKDFYTTSNFRDLTLHVSERCFTLPEIAAFLEQHRLIFRGFQAGLRYFGLLQEARPAETWPGTLEGWAAFERAHPHLFNEMYVFWCERAAPPTEP